jgi:hypothetical protein
LIQRRNLGIILLILISSIFILWVLRDPPPPAPKEQITHNRQSTHDTPLKTIFRWTDEQGIVHYSDEYPDNKNIVVENKPQAFSFQRPFRVDINTLSFELPPETQSKIKISLSKISAIYESTLGIKQQNHGQHEAQINLKIYGDFAQFKADQQHSSHHPFNRSSHSESNMGFYNQSRNEMVTWKNQNIQSMLAVIAHIYSQVLLFNHIGYSPPWLHQGLAEYFKTIAIFDSAALIPINANWEEMTRTHLEREQTISLRHFLSLSNTAWHEHNGNDDASYAISWSLVYFMMGFREGQQLLQGLILTLEAPTARTVIASPATENKTENKTQVQAGQFSSIDYIEQHYYGGIQKLETDWRQWMRRNKTAHRY